jgi:hypothetical protein
MAQILILVGIALVAVMATRWYRTSRDVKELTARVAQKGGQVVRLTRKQKGSPFADTGRGWWAWQVLWRDGEGEHTAWVLTTREGISEWRD